VNEGRGAGLVGLGLGLLAAGAVVGSVAGAAVERRISGRPLRAAAEAGFAFGSVHSPPVVVTSDDGVELYVEIDEPRPGAQHEDVTIVFSHGYALNLDCWHFQRIAFSGSARCVYWDQRGHGRSGRGKRTHDTIDRLAQDLEAVLEAVVPTGPVVLVGHSMGGMTILALAARRPDLFGGQGGPRVVGVGLLATSAGDLAQVTLGVPASAARVLHRMAPGVLSALGRVPGLVELGRKSGNDLEFMITRAYAFSSDVSPQLVDFTRRMNAATSIEVVADLFGAFELHDARAGLPALAHVPVLVMVGADDLLTPVEHSEALAQALPDAELEVLPRCGHMILLEYPEIVTSALRRLLEDSDPPPDAGP
jgi:pimeloyl-ACP methyl ester carboxylesterase